MITNLVNNLYSYGYNHKFKLIPLIVETKNKTGLLNPSLFIENDDLHLNLRHVQYVLYHSENKQRYQSAWGPLAYLHPENDLTLTTTNYFSKSNISIIDSHDQDFNFKQVDTSKLDVTPIWEFVGLEDARVVKWDNKIYLCGVRRDTTTNGQGRMEMSEIEYSESDKLWKEVNRYRLDTPFSTDTYCEKNWMPINDKPFHFVKWTNPLEIVKVDLTIKLENGNYYCEQVHLSDTRYPFPRDIRGGGNIIKLPDNSYLMITHEVDLFKNYLGNKDAFYYHRFLQFNNNFELLGSSSEFNFLTGNIEFATGLAYYDKTDSIYITFGFQDNAAFLLRTSLDSILSLITTK